MKIQMKLKRNRFIFNTSYRVARLVFQFYYNIKYSGVENLPRTGPALVVAKHQRGIEIVIEGILLSKFLGRQGNWVMRDSLPKVLELCGGIRIRRPRDIKSTDKEERRRLLDEARKYNQDACEYMEWLYIHEEVIVAHPEGTRKMGAMGSVRREIFDFTRGVEQKHGIRIPVIPLGLEYLFREGYRPQVTARVGCALRADDTNIVEKVYEELRSLSNIPKVRD